MNFIDLTILIIAILFTIRGFIRGFVMEIASLVGLLAGYLVTMLYLDQLVHLLQSIFPSLPKPLLQIVSFLFLFIVTNLLLKILAQLLTKTFKLILLGWLNRLLGCLVGLLKSIILMSILVFIFSFIPGFNSLLAKADINHSTFYPLLHTLGPKLYKVLSKLMTTI
jgi:membrane protein required for colicin V production